MNKAEEDLSQTESELDVWILNTNYQSLSSV